MEIEQSAKLSNVLYDIRGPVLEEARRLEALGHRITKLNIGNPAPFGFEAPPEILVDVVRNLPTAQGYSDSQGIVSARTAIVQHYQTRGIDITDPDDVWLGNGVSELIQVALQALLDDGDEVLIPSPDYPLWTASTTLAGGHPVHYLCDETDGWQPDLDDVAAKITDRTKAIVVINPNNPTGAVYSPEVLRGIAELAARHQLVVMADEIYDKILYDDAVHTNFATVAPDDVLVLTFNGLSKAYRLAGFRSGWMVITGPRRHASSYIEGITLLTNMRLCANVPAQHAIQTALGGRQSINELVLPGGRLLAQRDAAVTALRRIPGVSCVQPKGALYVFPRLDPEQYPIADDRRFVLDLLRAEHVLVVQGTGFNWPAHDHLRIVTLPWAEDLTEAIGRLGRFLSTYEPPVD
jgi:alanine-synthesizing transaminase